MSVFGKVYSSVYDSLYGTKDYARECDMIEMLAGASGSKLIMDIGCGTGGHAVQLAKRGHRVLGVDRSPAMLEIAQQKAVEAGVIDAIEFLQGDLRNIVSDKICDLALMMFAVLGYQQSNEDVRNALNSVARHLKSGAPFIFDVWYGPAVLADPPGARQRVIETDSGRIVRTTESQMMPDSRLCTVNFTLEHFEGDVCTKKTSESHVMRYFFPNELEAFAAEAGFVCERMSNFAAIDQPANEDSWNAIILFRKQ